VDGNRATMTYPDGTVLSYAYTGRNQLLTIKNGHPNPVVTYSYDKAGKRVSKTFDNGTKTTYAYDNAGRLLSLVNTNAAQASLLARFDYTLDAMGNRLSKTEVGTAVPAVRSETYSYDAIDQLTGVGYVVNNLAMRNVSYQYDPVGNRQQVTDSGTGVSPVWYTANNLNQYTMVGGNNLSYDAKGNLQTVPGWTYQYDAQNRLLSASSVSSVVQFSYDARNRCVARTVNGNITRFVYDGWSLLEERNASGVEQCRYYHGAMIDELLLRITANTYYYHHDGLGSTIALTDYTGALAESYTYDAFGTATILSTNSQVLATSAIGNRFLYTGREYLADVGLYDYRNRFYSPWLGRFLQTDPIGFSAGDVNLYRYVGNSINVLIDPFGLEWTEVAGSERFDGSEKWTFATFSLDMLKTGGQFSLVVGVNAGWSARVSVTCECNGKRQDASGTRVMNKYLNLELTDRFVMMGINPTPMKVPSATSVLDAIGKLIGKLIKKQTDKLGVADANAVQNLANLITGNAPSAPDEGNWDGDSPCSKLNKKN
jgi:RHS repeat-associated protein